MVRQPNPTSHPLSGWMSSMVLKKSTKDSGTIGQIRSRLPGTFKHPVTLPMHKKLINNLAMKGDSVGIQSAVHLKFTGVASGWKGVSEVSTKPIAG